MTTKILLSVIFVCLASFANSQQFSSGKHSLKVNNKNAIEIKVLEPAADYAIVQSEMYSLKYNINEGAKISSVKVFINNELYKESKGTGLKRVKGVGYKITQKILLKRGENNVTIAVKDEDGVEKTESISITFQKRLALIVGNAKYESGNVLANPVNDARAIENALRGMGFTVVEIENAGQKDLKKGIDQFGNKLPDYDVGLFYYAGHGIQFNGENYLVPIDALLSSEQDVEYNCVAVGRVLAKMEYAGTKTNIIILDACRDNPFARSWSRSSKSKGLAFMDAPSGSLIAYATSPGQTAADGKGINGLYTESLLKYMKEPGMQIEQVFKAVRKDIEKKSNGQQVPWESTSLKGNFLFK